MRSAWKGRSSFFFRSVRCNYIDSSDVGKRVVFGNGKTIGWVVVRSQMVGLKFGSFLLTKRLGGTIHTKQKKSRKKK